MTDVHTRVREANRRRFLAWLAAGAAAAPLGAGAFAQTQPVNATQQTVGPLNVFDYEALAAERIPPAHWGYLQTGVLDDMQVRANRAGFEKFGIRPRRLVNPSTVDMSVDLFGTRYASPILLAPIGAQGAFHPEGEAGAAKAAKTKDILQILSTVASHSIEEVIELRGGPAWFQLYTTGSKEVSNSLVARAEAAGSSAIVLTTDLLGGGMRRETAARYAAQDARDCNVCHDRAAGFAETVRKRPNLSEVDPEVARGLGATWVTWDYVAELRDLVQSKLILKGLVTAEDAEMALGYGVDGIIISNHGGRSEESGISTIEALAEIAPVVNGRVPLILDSGVRRGPDIFKAIGLGATAVGVGRPACWGLGADGQAGVEAVIDILNQELGQIMRQAGAASLAEISQGDYVRKIA
jgi:isopentenyl diphosphate isomerase/L-lactate dehydrogenase-like FMN-dependent dehydrogenase